MGIEGLLNTTVKITSSENVGSDFHPIYTWTEVDEVAARVRQLSEREVIRSEGGTILADYKCYILPTTVTTDYRIEHGSDIYKIYAVNDVDGMAHHYEIMMLRLQAGEDGAES